MQGSLSPQIKHNFPGLPISTKSSNNVKVSLIGVWSAALFAFSSFSLVAVNKIILTSFSYPSPLSLALGQMVASVLVLSCGHFLRVLSLPQLSLQTLVSVQPLPPLYLINALSGLTSTQMLPLPMFTVLRRYVRPLLISYILIIDNTGKVA